MSGLFGVMQRICARMNRTFVLFADSAYPISNFLFRMYRGHPQLTQWQAAFNSSMAPHRVSVEWGFAKLVGFWPWLDVAKAQQMGKRDVGAYLRVGNVFTNMHTCLYGNGVGTAFGLSPPDLRVFMAGGPF
jgi:hypothetical protein